MNNSVKQRQPRERFVDHELVASIDACLAQNPTISATKFGRVVSNDSMLLANLREGRNVSIAVRRRIEAFIATPLELIAQWETSRQPADPQRAAS